MRFNTLIRKINFNDNFRQLFKAKFKLKRKEPSVQGQYWGAHVFVSFDNAFIEWMNFHKERKLYNYGVASKYILKSENAEKNMKGIETTISPTDFITIKTPFTPNGLMTLSFLILDHSTLINKKNNRVSQDKDDKNKLKIHIADGIEPENWGKNKDNIPDEIFLNPQKRNKKTNS